MAANHTISKGEELFMRLLYLGRRTCDHLSRDLTKHALIELHDGIEWDAYIKKTDKQISKVINKVAKKYFKGTMPQLDKCDTSTLYEVYEQSIGDVNDPKEPSITRVFKTITTQRNPCAHRTNEQLTDDQYNQDYENFMNVISGSEFNVNTFPSLDQCLKFLEENKYQTFQHFCHNHPEEILSFVKTLESDRLELASRIEHLEKVVKELQFVKSKVSELGSKVAAHGSQLRYHDAKFSEQDRRFEALERRQGFLAEKKKPRSNLSLRNADELAGRMKDLKLIGQVMSNSQCILITGPPGIGKTSLATEYARQKMRASGDSGKADNCINLFVEFQDHKLVGKLDADIKNEIGRTIGALFPAVRHAALESDDALSLVINHLRDLVEQDHMNFLFILDNVDTILDAQSSNQLGESVQKLALVDENIKFICTARKKIIIYGGSTSLELGPLADEDCLAWLQKQNLVAETRDKLGDDILNKIVEMTNGIPLIMMIMHSLACRSGDLSADELDSLKKSDDWNVELNQRVKLYFDRLTFHQKLAMQCASIFTINFDKTTLIDLFSKCESNSGCGIVALRACTDRCLVQFSPETRRHYLHPYIKECAKSPMLTPPAQKIILKSCYILTYWERLLAVAQKQFEKDKFESVLGEVNDDIRNFENFLEVITSSQIEQLSIFCENLRAENSFSCYWLLSGLWFLSKIGDLKRRLNAAVEKLENLFVQLEMTAHVIICQCFLSHILRVMKGDENLILARDKIERASRQAWVPKELPATINFCNGYICFTQARFVQSTNKNTLNSIRVYDWQRVAAATHFERALSYYEVWLNSSNTANQEQLTTIHLVETAQVNCFYYREKLQAVKRNENAKSSLFATLGLIVKEVLRALGSHDETAYLIKVYADLLKFNGRRTQASEVYAEVFKLYENFGAALETQLILVLKEWSDCFPDNELALQMLEQARKIAEENYLLDSTW